MIMEQGYNLGLFPEGSQKLGGARLLNDSVFQYFSPTAQVEDIMEGFIGVQYWPDYSLTRTPQGLGYLSSLYETEAMLTTCVNVSDASNYTFLHSIIEDNASACAIANISEYRVGESLFNAKAVI